MRCLLLIALACLPIGSACAQEGPAISDDDILAAAGFTQTGGVWSKCGDPGTASYTPGFVQQRGDFNGDDRPDAVVTEGSVYCFGQAETGYTLISSNADGSWTIIDERPGIANLLIPASTPGWPDIEVGGPGFCFPVVRWNGSEYALNRLQYDGKPCQR